MSKQKNFSRKFLAIAIATILATVAIAAVIAAYLPTNEPETNDVGTPNLVSTNLQYTDNRTDPAAPFLRVTGTVTNNGNATANNCVVHANAIQSSNGTAINATQPFKSLQAAESTSIDVMFPYTGEALLAYNAYLEWTN